MYSLPTQKFESAKVTFWKRKSRGPKKESEEKRRVSNMTSSCLYISIVLCLLCNRIWRGESMFMNMKYNENNKKKWLSMLDVDMMSSEESGDKNELC